MNWTKRLILTGGLLCVILILTSAFAAAEDPGKGIMQRVLKLEQFVMDIKAVFTGQQQEIDLVKSTTENQTAEIEEMKQLLAEQQQMTSSLSQQFTELQAKLNGDVASLQQQLADEHGFSAALQSQISELQARVSQLENANAPIEKHRVSGTMVDADGKSFFSGFELVGSDGTRYPRSTGNFDAGAFTFEQIPNGTYDVRFYFSGYPVETPKQITINGSDMSDLQVKLAVPTFSVSGQATYADGSPMAHRGITLRDPHNDAGYWAPTNNDGTFSIAGIAPGNYTLQIGDSNSAVAETDITVTNSDLSDLKLRSDSNLQQFTVKGQVTFGGTPVQRAIMRLMDEGGYHSGSTDAEGQYNITFHKKGPYPLIVAEQGYKFGWKTNLKATAGTPTIADLEMVEGGTLAGKVQFSNGSDASFVSVKVLDGNGTMLNRIFTDSEGSYHLNAPEGAFTLMVEGHGQQFSETVDVTAGQTITLNHTF